jgi:hypothetical protein
MTKAEFSNIPDLRKYAGVLPFLLRQPVDISEAYGKLNPFDEGQYVKGISEFIVSNPPLNQKFRKNYPKTIDEVYKEYSVSNSLFYLFIPLLKDFSKRKIINLEILQPKPEEILYPQYNRNYSKESYWSTADALEALYSLGCPPLYMFHKTAHASVLQKDISLRKTILANPLSQSEVFITDKVKIPLEFLERPGEEYQYLVAFPMKEILAAQWKMKKFDPLYNLYLGSIGYLQVDVIKMDFKSLSRPEMEGILTKTKVFLPRIINKI